MAAWNKWLPWNMVIFSIHLTFQRCRSFVKSLSFIGSHDQTDSKCLSVIQYGTTHITHTTYHTHTVTYISKHEKFVARIKYIIPIHGVLANGPLNPSFNLHSEDQWVNPPMKPLYLVSDSASSSTISGVSGAELLLPFLPKRDKEIWLIEKNRSPVEIYMNSS